MVGLKLSFPVAKCTSGEKLQNSNVFLQLFGVYAPYILWMFLVFNDW